ncbi:MAG: hypothetical protein E7401_00815 [Ruminococcaceae bacterium]|nr:hypothetical protein [Oscillospiraceae bacterium]
MKRNIQLLISEEFAEKTIPENDSVRLLDEIIDEMDLTALYRRKLLPLHKRNFIRFRPNVCCR